MNIKEIKGFRYAAIAGEVKKVGAERLDIGLIVADSPCVTAGVTTTNKVFAAPVEITRSRLNRGVSQAVLVNSGNANALYWRRRQTGRNGTDKTRQRGR